MRKLRIRPTPANSARAGDWFLGRKSGCLHLILEVLHVRDSVVVTYHSRHENRTRRYAADHEFLRAVL